MEAGRAEVRAVIERAEHRRQTAGEPTIFFLDEIHRFNKAQQDALLPAVEEGLVTLIGATTENPYFEVNSALLSRTQVYELHALTRRGGAGAAAARDRARRVRRGDGRRRRCWSSWPTAPAATRAPRCPALELACEAAGDEPVTLEHAEDALQRKALRYDSDGDQHYDTISAWIKATRGSDPDASLYYLAVMLEGGEDPRFIARRMVILASEDIGNADPRALEVAVAAAYAVEHVGLPEGQFALAQAAIYLSLAPKSDAVKRAIGAARGARARARSQAAARLPALRRLPRRRQARPRRGLRLPARPPGARLRPGAAARRRGGQPLLRARRRPRRELRGAWRRSAARAGAMCDIDHTRRVLYRGRMFGCEPDRHAV